MAVAAPIRTDMFGSPLRQRSTVCFAMNMTVAARRIPDAMCIAGVMVAYYTIFRRSEA